MKERLNKFLETFWEKRFQFFESHWQTRKVQFFESEKDFNSLSHLEKRFINRGSIRWVKKSSIQWVIQKKVQYFESYQRKKSGILWVVLENFNSLSRIQKKSSMSKKKVIFKKKKSSILWVVFSKKKKFNSVSRIEKNQFCESYSYFKKFHFESHREKKGSILGVIFLKQYLTKRFKSVSLQKSQNSLSFGKNNLWVMFNKKGFNSLSHIFNNLWVILKKVQFFVSCFCEMLNSLSVFFFFFKKNSKIQFLSHIQKINSLSPTPKRGRFYSFSHAQKIQLYELHSKVQFFESDQNKCNSYWEEVHKRGSIQWVIYKEFNPLSHCWKKQKRVQFFESFFQTGSIISVSQNFR